MKVKEKETKIIAEPGKQEWKIGMAWLNLAWNKALLKDTNALPYY